MDGIFLARVLRDQCNQTMVVFVSSSQELTRRGYQVEALMHFATIP